MDNKGYYILLICAVLFLGCADRFSGDSDAMSDRAIVLSSDVANADRSKAVVENTTALEGIQFLRKDGTGSAPSDFSGASVVVGDRATSGSITFTPTVPTYKLNNDNCYFRAYHPAGVVSSDVVTWAVDGMRDIVVSSVFDAGNYVAPITGPMVFRHVLAQLEVHCVADPSALISEDFVQLAWGKVTKVELLDSYAWAAFDYATGVTSGSGSLGSVALANSTYSGAFVSAALTKVGFTASGMLVAASAGTAPLKLRITTERGGAQDVEVQLKSGATEMGFAAGLRHTITLQFSATPSESIEVAGTRISEWATGHSSSVDLTLPINPPATDQYVEINGLKWTVGNLVAKNHNECMVGAPSDGGLYFKFGSLVGWSGGASGDGVGTGEPALDKAVWPRDMGLDQPSHAWISSDGAGVNTLSDYYFNYSMAPWDVGTSSSDVGLFAETVPNEGAATGTLRGGRYANLGVGDPCTYYLGSAWRLPTADEYVLLDGTGRGGWTTSPVAGRWFGPIAGATGRSIFFPASGHRNKEGGAVAASTVGVYGNYRSSSIGSPVGYGTYMSFNNASVSLPHSEYRGYGFAVRCVSGTYVVKPSPINPPAPGEYVTIGALQWAKGNLVAKSSSNYRECKVGKPTDGGLYFQFGSLIGYKGGAPANGGTGVGMPDNITTAWGGATAWSWGNDVMVLPPELVGTPSSWPHATAGTVHQWYFSSKGVTSGEINATDVPNGVGDPCRYYLGGSWRLPTTSEWGALAGAAANQGPWVTTPAPGRWLGVNPGSASNSIFFPASGSRGYSNGSFYNVTTFGYYWSSSVYNASYGYNLTVHESAGVTPQNSIGRSYGFSVRCVRPVPTVPHPPAASDYVTIGALKWAKGNLVAVNGANCKVGAATDYGVYFQFGSLVGWSGGAGTTNTSLGITVQVNPAGYTGSTSWPAGHYADGTTDDKGYNLPTMDALTTGIGDPCRYYLGAPWRTPTAAEWLTLLGTSGANTDKAIPLKITGHELYFPASGYRQYQTGEYHLDRGTYWSSSTINDKGYYLDFATSGVSPQVTNFRSYGFPVRCVASV